MKECWWCCIAFGVIVWSLSGCGASSGRQETAPVAGTVTFKGEAVPSGSLLFVPVIPGPSAQATLKPDGTFSVGTYEVSDGMIPGEYLVAFQGTMTPEDASSAPILPEDVPLRPKKPSPNEVIPEKYGNQKTSGLTAKILPRQKNQLTFELNP